jgi:hypothetical protein
MRWKAVERGVAQRLGTTRIPLLGRKGCDMANDALFIEVKSQKRIAPYLWRDFFAQILAGAKNAGDTRVPAVVLHRPGMDYDDALLCIRVGDYERLVTLINQNSNIQTT